LVRLEREVSIQLKKEPQDEEKEDRLKPSSAGQALGWFIYYLVAQANGKRRTCHIPLCTGRPQFVLI